MNHATTFKGFVMIAFISPAALPALRIAGALFLIIYLLAGAYFFRHRRQLFGRDRALMVTMRPLAMYASKSF